MRQDTYNMDQVIGHFHHIKSWLVIPENEEENQRLIAFARDLRKASKDGQEDAKQLLPLILEHIEEYEKRAYWMPKVKANQILSFLMEQHQLTQYDLPEIGSQSLVSKILNGERRLTVQHIEMLSNRFNISPSVFF